MSKVFIIAEAACTWLHGGLEGAFRSIQAAKDCGADAWKTQWTSDPEAMAMRRGVARDKYTRLAWAGDCLPKLKAECDKVGIEFMCTVFIPKDIPLIAPYVSRFKVSAFEGRDGLFIAAHYQYGKEIIVSNGEYWIPEWDSWVASSRPKISPLYCVSQYPTNLEDLKLGARIHCCERGDVGLSDHTTSTLTGAVAVGAGARIIEKHVRLSDTPSSDPDYGHSLVVDDFNMDSEGLFFEYVQNIRLAERML